jgi:hypothetical protein
VTFADVAVTFNATSAKSHQRGVKQNSSTLQRGIFKKKIYRDKIKLAYFAGDKDLLTLYFIMFLTISINI